MIKGDRVKGVKKVYSSVSPRPFHRKEHNVDYCGEKYKKLCKTLDYNPKIEIRKLSEERKDNYIDKLVHIFVDIITVRNLEDDECDEELFFIQEDLQRRMKNNLPQEAYYMVYNKIVEITNSFEYS